ncbi:MAG: DUF1963 domain-containing protein [Kofleriaceae bacterium]
MGVEMTVDDDLVAFRARLDAERLPTEDVLAQTRTEIRIVPRAADPACGASRLGGAPDLPPGMAWPRHRWSRAEIETWPTWAKDELAVAIESEHVVVEGERVALALPFVAQLDLAELAPLQDTLPRTGHLWLFADQSSTLALAEGYPFVASACLYGKRGELVPATPPPLPEAFTPAAISFVPALSVPDVDDLFLTREDSERYAMLRRELVTSPRHAVLPRAAHGTTLVPPASFTPILRLDTDPALGMHWGDAAWIAFALPDGALAAGRFRDMHAFRWIG